jgi:Uma2 family endonuclease
MTIATSKNMTLEEYLNYDPGSDTRYELVDGVLIEMGAEDPLNVNIAVFLLTYFVQLGVPFYRLAIGHQIGVSSTTATARQPDLVLHSEASAAAILVDGKLLRFGLPAPMLVVEVVSSSTTDPQSRDRDYVQKRAEYAARGIPEYWIIDPVAKVVLVLALQNSHYQEQPFIGKQVITSPTFPELNLTAEQVLNAGRSPS